MKAAGVITVNSLGTAVNPGDGQCTLIEAIRSANADASSGAGFNECPGGSGTDTILVPAGVITLTGVNTIHFGLAVGLPAITTPLTIRGSGAGATIIERSTGAPDFGLIVASAALTVSDVTLRNGRSSAGGAIYSNAALTITWATFVNNSALTNGNGGGAIFASTATIADSTFAGNYSRFGAGAIFH